MRSAELTIWVIGQSLFPVLGGLQTELYQSMLRRISFAIATDSLCLANRFISLPSFRAGANLES
jgi:hypothetical protein